MTGMPLPPLPSIPLSWRSRVFSSQASPQTGPPDISENVENLPDTERLAFSGDAIVHLGVVAWLHERYPKYRSSTLMAKMSDLVSKKPAVWAKLYKLPSHVVVPTETRSHIISKGDLFRAYVAAVYLDGGGAQGGSVITTKWIGQLLELEKDSDESDSEEDRNGTGIQEDDDELSGMLGALLVPRSQEIERRPASQLPAASTSTQAPSSPNPLSILNERAVQKKVQLSWDDESSGPDHAKNWRAKLTAEGREFTGVGHNKKLARSAAAEVALKALRWSQT